MGIDIVVIAVIAALTFFAVSVLFVGALFWYAHRESTRRSELRDRIVAKSGELIAGYAWYPVRYASQRRFATRLKLFPWELAGILVVSPGLVRFIGETASGVQFSLQLTPANSRFKWLGRKWLRNGAASWIEASLTDGGSPQTHYLTSETGTTILGSDASTRELYQRIGTSGAPTEPAPPAKPISRKTWILVAAGSLAILALVGFGFDYVLGSGIRNTKAGIAHSQAKEWPEAVSALESARSAWVMTDVLRGDIDHYLAEAYMHVGRYEEALAAARRAQQSAAANGQNEEPQPYLTLARALSFRYAQTRKPELKAESAEQLVLFIQKAQSRKLEHLQMALLIEGTQHRLNTCELITDEDYIKKLYP